MTTLSDIDLRAEFDAMAQVRTMKWMRGKHIPHTLYGMCRECKAILIGDAWHPAPRYAEDGTIDHGVDVIVFPLTCGDEIIELLAFEPSKEPSYYTRMGATNFAAVVDLMGVLG